MAMQSIRSIQQLNQRELDACTYVPAALHFSLQSLTFLSPPSGSWHRDYAHTAFISFGSIPYGLSEGDIITIFSQYGNPVYINLVRDKETGKSKGFGFLKYEDQRSTDLAVDNLSGAEVLGRVIRVDHSDYKVKDGERIYDNTMGSGGEEADDGADDTEKEEDRRPVLSEERELERLIREHDEEDPMKDTLVRTKREEVEKAVARWKKGQEREERHKKRRHRSHRKRKVEDDEREAGRERKRRLHRSRSVDDADDEERDGKRRSRSPEKRNGEGRGPTRNTLRDRDEDRRYKSRDVSGDRKYARDGRNHRRRRHSSSCSSDDAGRRRRRDSTSPDSLERDNRRRKKQRETLVSLDEETNSRRRTERPRYGDSGKRSESEDERNDRRKRPRDQARRDRNHQTRDDP